MDAKSLEIRPGQQAALPATEAPVVNKAASRTRFDPSLALTMMVVKGAIGLVKVYQHYKDLSQNPTERRSIPQLIYNDYKTQIDYGFKFLTLLTPEKWSPFIGAINESVGHNHSFRNFLSGDKIAPDSAKWNVFAGSLAAIVHSACFYDGSKAHRYLQGIETSFRRTLTNISPNLNFAKLDPRIAVRFMAVLYSTEICKQYIKTHEYSRINFPQNETSNKLLKQKDKENSNSYTFHVSSILIGGALLFNPIVKDRLALALLGNFRNPSEMLKACTIESVSCAITGATVMAIADQTYKAMGRANIDALTTSSHRGYSVKKESVNGN